MKTNDLSLRKKIKLSSISTKEYYSKLNNKANSEISFSVNDKDIKNIKNTTENKEIKEFIKGYNAATQPEGVPEEETTVEDSTLVVETPDTDTSSAVGLIGIILLSGGAYYIYRSKKVLN